VWPHASGCINNGFAPAKNVQFLPELLSDSEYHSAYIGKWHLGEPGPLQRGFDEFVSVERVSDYSRFLISKGLKPDHETGGFSALTISNLEIGLSQPKFIERHACEFIQRVGDEAFILVVSFVEPHAPYNGPFNSEHPIEQVDIDPTANIPVGDQTPLRYRLTREWQRDRATNDSTGNVRKFHFGLTLEDYRALRQKYLGLITLIDLSIGAILDAVDAAGLRDETIITQISDHGDLLGAHQLFGKGVMFEEAIRVPWLIRAPAVQPRVVEQSVSLIDLVPTLLELMHSAAPKQCAGKSRVPLIRGEPMPAEPVFLEWSPYRRYQKRIKPGTALASSEVVKKAALESTRCVITSDGWKLCLRDGDLNELYNLNSDPGEVDNLYYSGRHREVIERARNEIYRWQRSTGDKLKLPN
jgi:arylsulfatase A-like enzyme